MFLQFDNRQIGCDRFLCTLYSVHTNFNNNTFWDFLFSKLGRLLNFFARLYYQILEDIYRSGGFLSA